MDRRGEAAGNLALLVVVDSAQVAYRAVDRAILAALRHCGLPYRLHDLARGGRLTAAAVGNCSAVVLGQEGVGRAISAAEGAAVLRAVRQDGLGLVSFDARLHESPSPLRELAGEARPARTTEVRVGEAGHAITGTREPGEVVALRLPTPLYAPTALPDGGQVLLEGGQGQPAVVAWQAGAGRAVHCALSAKVWLNEYLGHASGLDDLFWKALVWAARKPFVMRAMPPFVTARVDDCSGSGSPYARGPEMANHLFRYIDVFNDHGYIPNVGLFTDDLTSEDTRVVTAKHTAGLAEFSPHDFTGSGGITDTLIYGYMDGRERSKEELDRHFAHLDEQAARWGIRWSRTVNSHFQNPGLGALSYLAARGQDFMMFDPLFGSTYYDYPYGYEWPRGPYGHYGFIHDYLPATYHDGTVHPLHRHFFTAQSHPYATNGPCDDGDIDVLWGHTTFRDECAHNDVRGAARKAARGLRLGLDSLFFGCVMIHEQRFTPLRPEDFGALLDEVRSSMAGYALEFRGYDGIAAYARALVDSWLTGASFDASQRQITCTLGGEAGLPTRLYVFGDDGLGVSAGSRHEEAPAFAGSVEVSFGAG